MAWFKKLWRSKKHAQLERLVRRLIFYREESVFLDALREATTLAANGNDLGVLALTEALRRRCGRSDVAFYAPSFGVLKMRTAEECEEAGDRLLDLAKANRLLDDPEATQNLISAALHGSQDGLHGLVTLVFAVAGREAGYDFQLLYNQLHSSVMFRHAHGERTWTEMMSGR
ncbi:MAG: hypothetical protein P8076_01420 [Gammaproteobacteria bacterium]